MNKRILMSAVLGGVILVGGIYTAMSTKVIKQGHVGVVFSANGGVIEKTLSSGWHWWINPFHKITQYPISLDSVKYKGMELATKDGKPLTMDIEYDYKNVLEKVPYIFETWKGQKAGAIEENFLRSRAKESSMSVTSKYTVLEVFQNYEKIKTEIGENFTNSVKEHGFEIENFVLGAPEPDESTKQAIQAVVDAQQQLEALKIEKQKAQEVAARQLIEAQGVADAQVEKAKGEAESNRLIQASITPELLQKMDKEARLKHGWVTMTGVTPVVTTENK